MSVLEQRVLNKVKPRQDICPQARESRCWVLHWCYCYNYYNYYTYCTTPSKPTTPTTTILQYIYIPSDMPRYDISGLCELGGFMHIAPKIPQSKLAMHPDKIQKRVQQLPHGMDNKSVSCSYVYPGSPRPNKEWYYLG